MKIFCIIPVHNRLKSTRTCIEKLMIQQFDGELEVVVIDDGSTDGTHEFLEETAKNTVGQSRCVSYISGDGSWWWSKCINVALESIQPHLSSGDGVLFLNDDVEVKADYISELLMGWSEGESVVMSQLVNLLHPFEMIDSVISINPKNLEIKADKTIFEENLRFSKSQLAPGRGSLYPATVIIAGFLTNEKELPHYLSDYEFSMRIAKAGWPIVCAHGAHVLTTTNWGNARNTGGLYWRLFAPESPHKISAYWRFWRIAIPEIGRIRLLFRITRFRVLPNLRVAHTS